LGPEPHTAVLDRVVREIADEMRQRPDRGEVATYIPELAPGRRQSLRPCRHRRRRAHRDRRRQRNPVFDPEHLEGLSRWTLALGKVGDRLWRHVGREPSGSPFNSIVQLERERRHTAHPFINAGAIAVTDMILPA